MEYTQINEIQYFISLKKGENFTQEILNVAKDLKLSSGSISGIGALSNPVIGAYDLLKQKYDPRNFEGLFELLSCSGNLSLVEGELFAHLHVTISDHDCNVYGGHLFDSIVGITGEVILTIGNAKLERIKNKNIGLNLIEIKK